jgi:preprotein translocase subunit SecA
VSAITTSPTPDVSHALAPPDPGNRLGWGVVNRFKALLGLPWQRRLGWAALQVPRARYWEKKFEHMPDEELRAVGRRLRGRARGGESLDAILPEAFGLVCVACRRLLNMRPFDVQLAAGGIIHKGGLAEVATGEGKTLVATLPAYLNALEGKGVHVITVNDYLARRDAELMGPLNPGVQRPHHFALVDEADNIFIDEARTPLIIATPTRPATPEECLIFNWADGLVRQMKPDEHFTFDMKKQKLELTSLGKQLMRYANPPIGPKDKSKSHAVDKLTEHVEQALQAHYRFRRDQHYMVDQKGKVVIIDEFTGRPMPDRHWREGLHQAVEAKEGVEINHPSEHAAQITFQSYFRLYKKLSGMTGTAVQNRLEIRRVYKLWVVQVMTNRPCIRKHLPDRVFPNEDAKFDAVVEDVVQLKAAGRAVLIGTRSVDKSMELSRRLTALGIEHQVLNAQPERAAREAEVVARAGQVGTVTIATNMAGRGTDIKPDQAVLDAGGVHVIGTERHEARRIDRQLIGRTGRQGNIGSSQFMLSLEDELLEGLGQSRWNRLKEIGRRGKGGDWNSYLPLFMLAQRRVERRHYISRVDLMVHEKQRQEILKDLGADPYVD